MDDLHRCPVCGNDYRLLENYVACLDEHQRRIDKARATLGQR